NEGWSAAASRLHHPPCQLQSQKSGEAVRNPSAEGTAMTRRIHRAQLICRREGCDAAFVRIRTNQRFCSDDCQVKAKNDRRTPTGNRPGRPRRVIRTEPTPAYPRNAIPVILNLPKRTRLAASENPDLADSTASVSDPDQSFLDPLQPRSVASEVEVKADP